MAVSLAGTGQSTCAATDEAEVWCWGAGYDGGLGDGRGGTAGYEPQVASSPVKAQTTGEQVSSGTCSLDAAGTVKCWGWTAIIEDGEGSRYSQPSWGSRLPRTYGFAPASQVAGRCAITRADGRVQCQGYDNYGESGSGSAGGRFVRYPNPPPSNATAVFAINVSGAVSLTTTDGGYCAATGVGEVWCWGRSGDGQLGDGLSGYDTLPCENGGGTCSYERYSSTPKKVPGITDALSVHGTCAIRVGGTVTCWGKNQNGRFLPGTAADAVLAPTDLSQFAGATDLSLGYYATCAVRSGGQPVCQGTGVLGDGVRHTTPALVGVAGDGSPVAQIEVTGYSGACMRYVDGRIDCWGQNSLGQLGLGFVSNQYPNDTILVPSPVLGFGGEEDVDPLAISITLDPATVGPGERTPGQPVSIGVTIKVTNRGDTDITRATLRDLRLSRIFAGEGLLYDFADPRPVGPDDVVVDGPPDVIGGKAIPDIPAKGSVTLRAKFLVETPGAFEVKASVRGVRDGTRESNAVASPPLTIDSGLGLTLEGVDGATPDIVEMVGTITNNSGDDVTLDWAGGLGLDVLSGTTPLVQESGPTPTLPTTLADEEQVEVRWRFSVREVGVVVGVLKASGETAAGDPVEGVSELSVTVSATDVAAADMQRVVVSGMSEYLDTVTEFGENLEAESTQEELSASEIFRRSRYEQYRSEGFSDAQSEILAGVAVDNAATERYLIGFANARDQRALELGDEFVAGAEGLYGLATNPERRNALATDFVDGLKTNGGYLGDAFAIPVPEKLTNIWNGLRTAGVNSATALQEAAVGTAELHRIDNELYEHDRFAFADQAAARHGRQFSDFNGTVITELATEGLTLGAGKALAPVKSALGKGVSNLRRVVSGGEEASVLARVGGDDALGAATRELAQAEARAERYADLEYGDIVEPDELARLGGFSEADSAAIDGIVREAEERFGVELEITARTAEPLSVDIADGVGKQAFNKEKAVGELDKLLGAPDILGGRMTVFEPKPLSAKKLAAMEAREPGFTIRYEKRLETQQKYWKSYQAGEAKTYRMVKASEASENGITALADVPGNKVNGVEWLEQLDDPAYVESRGWTPEFAADLRGRLERHPSATRVKLVADEVDGAVTFSDEISGTKRPIVSDYDIQSVRPKGGAAFPAGKQGEIEAFVKRKMDELGRSGQHGWSGAANDLPSENFDLAAEFIMNTAHPAVARQTAESLAGRFAKLAKEFRTKAAKLVGQRPGARLPARHRRAVREAHPRRDPEEVAARREDDRVHQGSHHRRLRRREHPMTRTIGTTARLLLAVGLTAVAVAVAIPSPSPSTTRPWPRRPPHRRRRHGDGRRRRSR